MPVTITFVHMPNSVEVDRSGKPILQTPIDAILGATELNHQGFECIVFDLQLVNPTESLPLIAERILRTSPDMICFMGMANLTPKMILLFQEIKSCAEIPICLCGYAVEGIDELILSRFMNVAFIMKGNDFNALGMLVRKMSQPSSWEGIPSLTYRRNGNIFCNPRSDAGNGGLTVQDFSLIPLDQYMAPASFASRGCSNQCSFCKRPFLYGHKVWFRPVEVVYEEVQSLFHDKRMQKEAVIQFVDDTFAGGTKHGLDICSLFARNGMAPWACFHRVDKISDELLEVMAAGNCQSIFLGIESGSDRILKRIGKGFTIEEAKRGVTLALRYIPQVMVSFIWGFPDETREEFVVTLELAKWAYDLGAVIRVIAPLMVYPGTPDYYQFLDQVVDLGLYSTNLAVFAPVPMTEVEETIIVENPDIFTPYYFVPTEDFVYKAETVHLFVEKVGGNRPRDHKEYNFGSL